MQYFVHIADRQILFHSEIEILRSFVSRPNFNKLIQYLTNN